jgi:ketosteroid isomerase-like protein
LIVTDRLAVIERLVRSTNDHDIDGLVACFAPDYVNVTPVHPDRGFVGSSQVRQNWEQIFRSVPDVHASVLRSAVGDDAVWTEWEMRGTRPDGSLHLMRGVIIFGVDNDVIGWARFFLEVAEEDRLDVNEALSRQLGAL